MNATVKLNLVEGNSHAALFRHGDECEVVLGNHKANESAGVDETQIGISMPNRYEMV